MKKYFILMLAAGMLWSCKKENKEAETETATEPVKTEAKEAINYKPVFSQSKPLQEVTEAETENIVAPHDNDTLYVTNFFATWCGPCMREIPEFQEKMKELKGQPVKFTFVSMDEAADWPTEVAKFGKEKGLASNIVLLDGSKLTPEFFSKNFKTWNGGAIPFTLLRKKDKSDETVGGTSKEELTTKINSLNQ